MFIKYPIIKEFIAAGSTEEELRLARQNIMGGFSFRIESNGEKVRYLAMIGFYGLPLDYLKPFTSHGGAVTLEQIRKAFQRRIDPDKLATVRVGGAAKE